MKALSVLFFILLTSFSSCGDKDPKYCDGGWDTRLKIVNTSDKSIYVYHSAAYPDTNSYSLFTNYDISKPRSGYIRANDSIIKRESCTWDDYFEKYVNSDTLMIFVILDEGQGQDHLKDHHTVLKRYDLTLQDLEKMNWTVTYP